MKNTPENKLDLEIEVKLRKIFSLYREINTLKNEVEDHFTKQLEYAIDDGENYNLEDNLNKIFADDANDIDEIINTIVEELANCEFQED